MLFELDECFDANFHAAIVQSHSCVIRNFGAPFKRIQNRFFHRAIGQQYSEDSKLSTVSQHTGQWSIAGHRFIEVCYRVVHGSSGGKLYQPVREVCSGQEKSSK